MAEIVDLDELLGAPKKVRVGGKVYTLPPDLPAELYLKIIRLARENASEAEMIEALSGQLLELFQYGDPKMKALPPTLTISQVVLAVGKIYGDGGSGERRPPRATRGGASSRRTRTS